MDQDSLDLVYVKALHKKLCDKCSELDTWEYSELTKANLSAHIDATLEAAGPVNDVRGHAHKSAAWLEKNYPIVQQEPTIKTAFDVKIVANDTTRIAESELDPRAEEVKKDRNKMADPTVDANSKTMFTRELSFKHRDRLIDDTRRASENDNALWVHSRNHLPKKAKIDQSTIRTVAFRQGKVVFDTQSAVKHGTSTDDAEN